MTYKPSAELIAKHAKYLELLPQAQGDNGFIEFDKCDSTLFSGLLGCVPGTDIRLSGANNAPGKWYRRVLSYPECYAIGGATSEISRDMFVGIAWYAWCNKCPDIAEGICDYALSHFGIMGRGKLSQTLMSPSLLNTFAHISEKLGGKSYPVLRRLPTYISPNLKGFERHLAVLDALLRQKMGLKVDNNIFFKAADDQRMNPLYQYTAGLAGRSERILLDRRCWPTDRLPTNQDRAEPWLPQRDFGPDWESDTESDLRVYSGGDFLFVSALLQGLI